MTVQDSLVVQTPPRPPPPEEEQDKAATAPASILPNVPEKSTFEQQQAQEEGGNDQNDKDDDTNKSQDKLLLQEEDIQNILGQAKDLIKHAPLEHSQEIRTYISTLKETLKQAQDWNISDSALRGRYEKEMETYMKLFSWMLRTFSYPLLYMDEITLSETYNTNESTCPDKQEPPAGRIPFDILVPLHDRMPSNVPLLLQGGGADLALVVLRIQEWYKAAKEWQGEISQCMDLSFRGGQRRSTAANSPVKGNANEDENNSNNNDDVVQARTIERLAANPILNVVAMPRADAVASIVRHSQLLQEGLQKFLTQDAADPDFRTYPVHATSLVGDQGEFLLYKLTCSPLFHQMTQDLDDLATIAQAVLAETPAKMAWKWVTQAVTWVQALHAEVQPESPFGQGNQLAIPKARALELLDQAQEIFLHIQDDVRKTLSKYGLYISSNKQETSLTVAFLKRGAHHSLGGTTLRWCPLLLECLRNDVAALQEWETKMSQSLHSFETFFAKASLSTPTATKGKGRKRKVVDIIDKATLYQWYEYETAMSDLLRRGSERLIVVPETPVVTTLKNLLDSVVSYLSKHSNATFRQEYERQRYETPNTLIKDRFLRLDTLQNRKRQWQVAFGLDEDSEDDDDEHDQESSEPVPCVPLDETEEETGWTFRDTCRQHLEKAMRHGMSILGMDLEGEEDQEALILYARMRVWDIENEMFDVLQEDYGDLQPSAEYIAKARSLKSNLSSRTNLLLAPAVLSGDISPETLVAMSSDEFILSERQKADLQKTSEYAKRQTVLADQPANGKKEDLANGDQKEPLEDEDEEEDLPFSAPRPLVPSAQRGKPTTSIYGRSTGERPSAPPSLAVTPLAGRGGTRSAAAATGILVRNADGDDAYHVEIARLKVSFSIHLYAEDVKIAQVAHGFLPSTLVDKGRLQVDEFSRFVSEKLATGRWQAFALRVATRKEEDIFHYIRFYKDYERSSRIAMFAIHPTNGSKLFLVTPKFHGACRQAAHLALATRKSSYAVILTKEKLVG